MGPLTLMAAMRRVMRRHQDVPDRKRRVPMWRLLAGEVGWAIRQVSAHPLVLAGLAGGFVATIAVLSATAPGPILDLPWRVLLAIAAGLLLATGARTLEESSTTPGSTSEDRPLLGATVVSAAITAVVLVAWLAVWTLRLAA